MERLLGRQFLWYFCKSLLSMRTLHLLHQRWILPGIVWVCQKYYETAFPIFHAQWFLPIFASLLLAGWDELFAVSDPSNLLAPPGLNKILAWICKLVQNDLAFCVVFAVFSGFEFFGWEISETKLEWSLLFLLIWTTPFLLCKKGRSSTERRAMRKQEWTLGEWMYEWMYFTKN